jgi:carboxypeptidase T
MNILSLFLAGLLAHGPQPINAKATPAQGVMVHAKIAVEGGPQAIDEFNEKIAWLRENDFDIAGFVVDEAFIGVVTPRHRLKELTRRGYRILDEEELRPLDDPLQRAFSDYYDPTEVQSFLENVAADHPNITRLFTIGTTWQGRTIWALEISNNPGVDENEPAVLFNGCHHSREVHTPHIVTDIIDFLTDGYAAGDPQAVKWVNNYKIICVPMVNPDGSNYVFTVNSGWRKNRRNNGGGTFGVDLNRNYPYSWGPGVENCERGTGSSGTPSSDIYRGPAPASEPETQTMIALADEWNFAIAVSYHSYGQFIDYPYACNDGNPDNRMPEHDIIHEMMWGIRNGIIAAGGPTYSVFSPVAAGAVNGDDTSWYYAHQGAYAMIIESSTSFAPPFSSLPAILSWERGGWKYLLGRLEQARIDVFAYDACTGEPIVAETALLDFDYDTNEWPRYTSLPFGRRTYLVVANQSYNLSVNAPGFHGQTLLVPVSGAPVPVHVYLMPEMPEVEMLGDMNLDGVVDGDDIQVFIDTLTAGPAAERSVIARGNFNGDCVIDENDIPPFVSLLLGQ